jgi:hypothetical protein
MSYTPCPLCQEPLIAGPGSACTSPSCRKVVSPGPARAANGGKLLPPGMYSAPLEPESAAVVARRKARRRAARAARRRNRR